MRGQHNIGILLIADRRRDFNKRNIREDPYDPSAEKKLYHPLYGRINLLRPRLRLTLCALTSDPVHDLISTDLFFLDLSSTFDFSMSYLQFKVSQIVTEIRNVIIFSLKFDLNLFTPNVFWFIINAEIRAHAIMTST